MLTIVLFLTVLLVIFSIGLIAAVILQSGRSAGLSGSIGGGAEAGFGKKKGLDDFLARMTIVMIALVFISGLVIAALER